MVPVADVRQQHEALFRDLESLSREFPRPEAVASALLARHPLPAVDRLRVVDALIADATNRKVFFHTDSALETFRWLIKLLGGEPALRARWEREHELSDRWWGGVSRHLVASTTGSAPSRLTPEATIRVVRGESHEDDPELEKFLASHHHRRLYRCYRRRRSRECALRRLFVTSSFVQATVHY